MDMTTFSPALPIFLLLAALAVGIWQRVSMGSSTSVRPTRAAQTPIGGTLPRVDALATDPAPSYR